MICHATHFPDKHIFSLGKPLHKFSHQGKVVSTPQHSCCHKISIKAGKLRPEYELIPINIRLYLRYFPPPFPLITHIYRSYIFLRISNSFYWFFYVLFSFCLCLFLPLLLLIIGLLCFCFCICFCFSFFMLGIFFF